MKELRQIGKIIGLPLYVDVAMEHPLNKDRKVELAEKILRRAFGMLEPKVKRVRRPRKKTTEIPVLPGQITIDEALENGNRTEHRKRSVHRRVPRTEEKGMASPSGSQPSDGSSNKPGESDNFSGKERQR